jgi:hypothetical protein
MAPMTKKTVFPPLIDFGAGAARRGPAQESLRRGAEHRPAGGRQARGHFNSREVGPARTAHEDRSYWCGRQHRRESAGKDIRFLHFGRSCGHVITELRKSTWLEEK